MENKVAVMENNFALMENSFAVMENNFTLMENSFAAMENNIPDHFEDILEMIRRCRPRACAGSHGNQANFHNPVQVARSATRCGVWARSAATLHPRPSATPAGGGEPRGEQVGIKEMMVFRTERNEQD
jgi:hypothetical protein